MKKRVFVLFIILVLIFITLVTTMVACTDQDYESKGGLKFQLKEDGTYAVVGTTRSFNLFKNVKIPSTFKDKTVTSIEKDAFYMCEKLKSITIPETVTYISCSNFKWCNNLSYITIDEANPVYHSDGNCIIENSSGNLVKGCKNSTIPDSVELIEEYAFACNKGIKMITIPNNVKVILHDAFFLCDNIVEIIIPKNLLIIDEIALSSCSNLKSIKVDKANPVYHSKYNCIIETETNKLVETCQESIIPDYVTSIGRNAFISSDVTSVNIPGNVQKIERDAFFLCNDLTDIYIPKSVISINATGLSSCDKLNKIIVDENNPIYHSKGDCIIETATDKLIEGCNTSVIPNYVTSIGENAFAFCDHIESIIIPSSVKNIGQLAFYSCDKLNQIKYDGTIAQWNEINKAENILGYDGNVKEVRCVDGNVSIE